MVDIISPGAPTQESKAKLLKCIRSITQNYVAAYTDGMGAEGVAAASFITNHMAAAYAETTPEGGKYLGKWATVPDAERAGIPAALKAQSETARFVILTNSHTGLKTTGSVARERTDRSGIGKQIASLTNGLHLVPQ